MEKKIAIFELNYSHACGERQWKPNAEHRQIFEWAVDNTDVRANGLYSLSGL